MVVLFCIALLVANIASLDCLDGAAADLSRLNFFDIDLLRYTAEERPGNVMVSPASIKSTLAMILEGSAGTTEDEIRSALRLSPYKEEFREQLNAYLNLLHVNTRGVTIENANAVFVSNKLTLKKDYVLMLQKVYQSELRQVDFAYTQNASEVVNKWVFDKTKGLIPGIIEPANLSPKAEMILTNALYFKGSWAIAFNPRYTRPGCFHYQGACMTVAMMELHAELNCAYVDNLRAHAIELVYEGGDYSMVLLVPLDRDGIAQLIRDLPYMSLAQITPLLEPTDVRLIMPKFTVDYTENMALPLKNMRIETLFTKNANLSGIYEGASSQVDNIIHKVHMSVDEKGTTAAAVSGAMVIPLIGAELQVKVDRPFVFFIRSNKMGLVLFEGKIEQPNIVENFLNDPTKHIKNNPNRRFTNSHF